MTSDIVAFAVAATLVVVASLTAITRRGAGGAAVAAALTNAGLAALTAILGAPPLLVILFVAFAAAVALFSVALGSSTAPSVGPVARPRRPQPELASALVAFGFVGLVGWALTRAGLPPGWPTAGAVPTELHLALGGSVFAVGIAGLTHRPNAKDAVASLGLMLGAVAFTLVAGDRRYDQPVGALAALVVIAVGSAQLAIAVGLLGPLLRRRGTADLDDIREPRG